MIPRKIKKILVPYDGSPCSKHAFKMALDLAHKYNSNLIVLSCIEKLNESWFGLDFSPGYEKEVQKHKKVIQKEIDKLEKDSKNMQVPFSSEIFTTDSTVKQILSFTKNKRVDLIVMGSHRRTGVEKLVLGSIANGVVQKSKIPVMIIR